MRSELAIGLTAGLTALTLALTACGGGGGGGGGGGNAAAPSVAIASSNAEKVAGAALDATELGNAADTGSNLVNPNPAVTLAGSKAVKRARESLRARAVAQAQESDTVACDTGSFDITADDADNNDDLSANDTIDIRFSNCHFAAQGGVTLNGRIFIRVTTAGSTSLGMSFQFTNLVTDAAGTANDSTVNGSTNAVASKLSGNRTQVLISGGSTTTQDASDTVTVANPNLTFITDNATQRYSMSGTATVTSNALGGTVALDIPASTPLTGIGVADPDSGSFNITGANSSMVVTVVGANTVKLDIDTSGDKVADESRTVTWDAITL
jgi:hypothetical protein